MRSVTAIIVLIAASMGALKSAHAIPPTVTPSPGYDARLAEQRRALQSQTPPVRAMKPKSKRAIGLR